MAAVALERLEREINGEPAVPAVAPLAVRPLLESAVERWQARVALGGGSIELEGAGVGAWLRGDGCGLARALDNLIANAIEHGGPEIVVGASLAEGRLRIAVRDSGPAASPGSRRRGAARPLARLGGRARRGHGLRVVRRIATAHRGTFVLRRGAGGTVAEVELPLPDGGEAG
jgi:signal transduction histidine kinase